MRHINLPIFIPHLGCPHTCVFCNQHLIAAHAAFSLATAKQEIDAFLATADKDAEIELAYFGGSFTALPSEQMDALLQLAAPYLADHRIAGIRVSTRPDAISDVICEKLLRGGVTTVELGVQSTDDTVLAASERGHTAADARQAFACLHRHGLPVIGQMMVGLPNATLATELQTARDLIAFGCQGVRIYPVAVFRGTRLETLWQNGIYTPLSVEEAVERSAQVLSIFLGAKLPVLRIGLCAEDGFQKDDSLRAGGYHPALGELVRSRIYLSRMTDALCANPPKIGSTVKIAVRTGQCSQAIGQKRENIRKLCNQFSLHALSVLEDPTLSPYQIRIL